MFLAVAEELQLAAAARRLGISRQTLSRNINRLESQLGTRVVVRTTRRVELTTGRNHARDHAIAIEAAMARAVAQVRVDQHEHTLTIAVSIDLPSHWYNTVQGWITERGRADLARAARLRRCPPSGSGGLARPRPGDRWGRGGGRRGGRVRADGRRLPRRPPGGGQGVDPPGRPARPRLRGERRARSRRGGRPWSSASTATRLFPTSSRRGSARSARGWCRPSAPRGRRPWCLSAASTRSTPPASPSCRWSHRSRRRSS